LERVGYRRRSLRKELITGHADLHEHDQQFRWVDTLHQQAHAHGVPVLCVDTKKKEALGYPYHHGQGYSCVV